MQDALGCDRLPGLQPRAGLCMTQSRVSFFISKLSKIKATIRRTARWAQPDPRATIKKKVGRELVCITTAPIASTNLPGEKLTWVGSKLCWRADTAAKLPSRASK
ncbi:hypothetical protein V2G26_015206 [Clonostachys chloroleuca]